MMMKRIERPRSCYFCHNPGDKIDFKNDKQMLRHVDDLGKIVNRNRTGLCALHQRHMTLAVKRARHLAMIPFVMENIR